MERFQCSPEARGLWGHLCELYELKRAGLLADVDGHFIDWGEGDAQILGRNWAEWGPCPPAGNYSDLGTAARLQLCAAEMGLKRLKAQGRPQSIGVALALRYLGADGVIRAGDIRRQHGLSYDTGNELVELLKEWLHWALGDGGVEPVLRWRETISS